MRFLHSVVTYFLFLSCFCLRLSSVEDPSNFTTDRLYEGPGMTVIRFDHNDNLYVAEKRGRILRLTPDGSDGFNAPTVVYDIQGGVESDGESGFLGMVFDPEYGSVNNWLYLLYTTSTDQRLVRLTLNASGTAVTQSAVILSGLPRRGVVHKAGDINFRPGDNDNIYIMLGDDGWIGLNNGFDEYNGKMLRVDKQTGLGIPSNPHWDGNADSIASRTYLRNLRNAFRFCFDPDQLDPDLVYLSENGGPYRAEFGGDADRLAVARAGSEGGWHTNGDTANANFENPPDPNFITMELVDASVTGILMVTQGPFSDNGAPVLYNHTKWSSMGNRIRRFTMNTARTDLIDIDNGANFATQGSAEHMILGPDGHIYYCSCSGGEGGNYEAIHRIRYIGGEAPDASFSQNQNTGPNPLTVQFTDTSTDSDGFITSWLWNFGDGNTSNQRNPSHTYNTVGNYTVTLTVSDDSGLSDQVTGSNINVYHVTNLQLSGTIYDANTLTPTALSAATEIRLYQNDGTTPISFSGGTGPQQNGISVSNGQINANVSIQLTGNGMVVSAGEPDSDGVHAAWQAFPIDAGASNHNETIDYYLSGTALRGRITDTLSQSVTTDIGIALGSPTNYYAFAGGRDYLAASGIPSTGVQFRTSSDSNGYYYIPLQTSSGTFHLDVVADTNSNLYLSNVLNIALSNGNIVERDITVGLQNGGGSADDLSSIPETPNIDYPVDIQPIWDNACIGCHVGTEANGSLQLTSNISYDALVNVRSTEVPGLDLVEPGNTALSYLFEKINSANPQVGARMRPDVAMSLQQQALIRDWINQGALPTTVVNQSPIVDAGAHQNVVLPTNTITLDATVTDSDDTPTVTWSFSGPVGATANFNDANATDTQFNFDLAGQYTLTLTANDGNNPPVSDSLTLTVSNAPITRSITIQLSSGEINVTALQNNITLYDQTSTIHSVINLDPLLDTLIEFSTVGITKIFTNNVEE